MKIPESVYAEVNGLLYDPVTGIFTWTKPTSHSVKVGSIAGSTHRTTGYVRIGFTSSIGYKSLKAHRLAWFMMTGDLPDEIDHINGIRHDNRFINLRTCNRSQQMQNKTLDRRNRSGVTGVCWHKNANKWHVQIGVNGKVVSLGYYADLPEAIEARKMAEVKHHGRFSKSVSQTL